MNIFLIILIEIVLLLLAIGLIRFIYKLYYDYYDAWAKILAFAVLILLIGAMIAIPYYIQKNIVVYSKPPTNDISKIDTSSIIVKSDRKYDEDGRIIYQGVKNGKWKKWKYNKEGKLIHIETSSGYWQKLDYNNGKLIRIETPETVVLYKDGKRYEYDKKFQDIIDKIREEIDKNNN